MKMNRNGRTPGSGIILPRKCSLQTLKLREYIHSNEYKINFLVVRIRLI